MYAKQRFGRGGKGGRGYGGGGRGGFQGDARFRGRGSSVHYDGGDGTDQYGKSGKGGKGAKGAGKGGKGFGGRGGGGRGSGAMYQPQIPLAERNAEIDRIDAVFGYEKIDKLAAGERVGWLTNMRTVLLEEGEDGVQHSAVEYYFLAPDGTGFKCLQPHEAYFYISVAAGHESDVDSQLRRKFAQQIKDVKHVYKEDLALANHLSGKQKLYLKLTFRSTRELMDVRKLLLPTVQKNRAKKNTSAAYAADEFMDASASGGSARNPDSWLDRIDDIRE